MNANQSIRGHLGNVFFAVLGACSSMVNMMGYYPLLPAIYATCCLQQRKGILLYLGIFLGMITNMPVNDLVKYLFVLLVEGTAIRFYFWANRRCSGIMGGFLAAIATIGMNCSGLALYRMDKNELILGISEGILVFGAVVIVNFVLQMATEYVHNLEKKDTVAEPEELRTYPGDGRIHAFVEAVDELSSAFSAMGRQKEVSGYESVAVLQKEITGKLCAACEGCAICWEAHPERLSEKISQMLQAVMAHHSKEEIIRKNYMEECPRYSGMVEEAIWAFSRMELNEAWYNRLKENRLVIAEQLDAMSDLLQDWSKGQKNIDAKSKTLLARIGFEAGEKGLLAEQVHIYEDENGRHMITAKVCSKWGGGIPSKNYLLALNKACKRSLRLERETRSILTREPALITAYEDTCFYALSGVASRKKDKAAVSGDNFSFFELDNGHYHICLSDGMGSGPAASKESDLVVELMEKFMEAGFPRDTAIRMMNSAMVMQGEDDSYSTMDFATVDLYSGELELTKIGAAASFLKSQNQTICLGSGIPPAGVDAKLEVAPIKTTVTHGDFLVMVTDGVLEYLHVKNPEEKLTEIISDVHSDHAGAIAKAILERVLLFTGGYAQDDMTIVVTGIWEK